MNANLNSQPTLFNSLKIDILSAWNETYWLPAHPEHHWVTKMSHEEVMTKSILNRITPKTDFKGFGFSGITQEYCPQISRVEGHNGLSSGAYRYRFESVEGSDRFDVLVVANFQSDSGFDYQVLACIPEQHVEVWSAFVRECFQILARMHAGQRVFVIGGNIREFKPDKTFDDVILPAALKADVLHAVEGFFNSGVEIYSQLDLKPFYKILLAGIPGTGKTMLTTALARWMLDQGYIVIYVSGSDCNGATFAKIERALAIAAQSECPTMILLEEIDAYLHKSQKASILNVLDGNETILNKYGTLLVATTNYPEAIDVRVKRPGRLDRIFIVPPLTDAPQAELMLKSYLDEQWHESQRALGPLLVGHTGAFVRTMALQARIAYAQQCLDAGRVPDKLPVELLMHSFDTLKAENDARDKFVKDREEQKDETETVEQVKEVEMLYS